MFHMKHYKTLDFKPSYLISLIYSFKVFYVPRETKYNLKLV